MDEETENGGAQRIYITEACKLLDRKISTLRKWESSGALPPHLRPHRGQRGWRYWTEDQIAGIQLWMNQPNRLPGHGLPYYDPSPEDTAEVLRKIRAARESTKPEAA